MPSTLASPERATFYFESPPLSQDAVIAKFNTWNLGDVVSSAITPVGMIHPTEDEQTLLQSRRLLRNSYGLIDETSSLYAPTQALGATLMRLVEQDASRTSLWGRFASDTRAGNYRDETHREHWHSDNFNTHPSVRWTVALGIGSTYGAIGNICREDFLRTGDLRSTVSIEPDGRLEPAIYPPGTVLRFMNVADVHAGPSGSGGRIMSQTTLYLQDASESSV